MVQYTDIHFSDLKNLSVKSFTQVLINDFYPFIYSEINKMETCINRLKKDYDIEILESTHRKIYTEFDALYRKEKLVLFPFIIKLDEEQSKSESCTPFKNTKVHYTSVIQHIESAKEIANNFFITDANNEEISCLITTLIELKNHLTEIQFIKEKYFYNPFKLCGNCSAKQNFQ